MSCGTRTKYFLHPLVVDDYRPEDQCSSVDASGRSYAYCAGDVFLLLTYTRLCQNKNNRETVSTGSAMYVYMYTF